MVAVKGLYNGGDTVKIDTSSLSFIHEPYEVVVAFLHPAKPGRNYDDEAMEQTPDKRKAGFLTFMNYKGILPADFDYRKELADYRDERYGRTH
ncbi:MAG: hypothetical protein LBC57_11140 [Treponema sp.]|jgi:hypothetical protein|nr:hypothetical protein [Treponema sp.]